MLHGFQRADCARGGTGFACCAAADRVASRPERPTRGFPLVVSPAQRKSGGLSCLQHYRSGKRADGPRCITSGGGNRKTNLIVSSTEGSDGGLRPLYHHFLVRSGECALCIINGKGRTGVCPLCIISGTRRPGNERFVSSIFRSDGRRRVFVSRISGPCGRFSVSCVSTADCHGGSVVPGGSATWRRASLFSPCRAAGFCSRAGGRCATASRQCACAWACPSFGNGRGRRRRLGRR